MRALGFDMKKAEVLKLLRDNDRQGDGLMDFDCFQRISEWSSRTRTSENHPCSATCRGLHTIAAWRHSNEPSPAAAHIPVTEKLLARDPLTDLRRAFALFDDDHTGRISLKNLKRVARELGENLGEEEL